MSTTLYPGIAFSPQTVLADNIGAADTIIPVADVSCFPDGPNLATIGTDETGETVFYAAKTADALSGCQRGVEGEARTWMAGEPVGRNFTAKDHNDLIDLLGQKQDKFEGKSGQVVGFNAEGKAVPQEPPVPPVSAAQVSYDGAASGLEAETVQGALDRLSAIKVDVGRVSNPNLLDNWYFADPINQRGQTEYIGFVYTIDRWITEGATIKVEDDGLQLENPSEGAVQFVTNFEASRLIDNQVYTAAILAKNLVGSGIMIIQHRAGVYTYLAANALSEGLTATSGQISKSGIPLLGITIRLEPHSSVKLIAAKLELGPVQTLAHKDASGNWVLNDPPPDKALELAKCQRCYLSSYINNPPGTPQTFENELVLIAIKNDRFNVNGIEFPARMRITPNVTFYAPGSGNPGYATESGSSNEVRIASVIAGPDRVNIGAPDNNLVVGHEYYLHYVADAML